MIRSFLLFISFVFLFSTHAFSDEGMWPFNGLCKDELYKKYRFKADNRWVRHVMRSSVRLNSGGSGSFVSPDGLVMTNHHVAADSLHKVSKPGQNYYENGFYARNLADEIKIPDLEINQLEDIIDVTSVVTSAVKPGMTPAQANEARKAEMAKIEKDAVDRYGPKYRADVVTLYNGEQFHLYLYRKYTDVRIVFAPEFKIAFFGGDPDNFEFPRFDLDVAFFRVYEDDKPAKVKHFFRWSPAGAEEGELVFVSGNPGSTKRLFTTAALEFLRDLQMPTTLDLLRRREKLFLEYSARGEEQARQAKKDLFSVQNSRKVFDGRLYGLTKTDIIERKRAAENELRARVNADPNLSQYAEAWDKIVQARATFRKIFTEHFLFEGGSGFLTRFFSIARQLVRVADENLKPNEKRLREYQEAGRKSLEQQLFSPAPIYAEFEEVKLADALQYLVEQIGTTHPQYALLEKILDGKSPKDRAAELVRLTKLADVTERKRLYEGGKAAIDGCQDPFILLAKLIDPLSREVRKEYEDKVEGVEQEAYPQIAKAIYAIKGTSVYPDATFTPRLAFGQVKGYSKDGIEYPAWSTLGGAFDHERSHHGVEPWRLPDSWHTNGRRLKQDTPFNFVSTADIIGGNSGSPVINRYGEVVGLIFDGNIDSLVADFFYDDKLNRAVSVDSRGITEALRKIYDANPLADELRNGHRRPHAAWFKSLWNQAQEHVRDFWGRNK